jgi:hypothetical protein
VTIVIHFGRVRPPAGTTRPAGATRDAASRARTPVPHAMSTTRSPGWNLAASAIFEAYCPKSTGTNSASYAFAASI